MPSHHVLTTTFLAAASLAAPVAAADLLANSSFDRDVAGWEEASVAIAAFDDGAIDWSSDDADRSAASGSLVVRDLGDRSRPGAATTCVRSIDPQASYVLDLAWKVPAEGAGGTPFVDFRFLMGPDCSGELVAGLNADLPPAAAGSWQATRKIVTAPATAHSLRVTVGAGRAGGPGPFVALFDDLVLTGVVGDCETTDTVLCIDGRFRIEVEFATVQSGGVGGLARAVPAVDLGMPRGGLFWFFNRDNPEMLVKVLDGCGANGHWWVFYSAVTNVGFTTTVVDTVTGGTWARSNPDLHAAAPLQDTTAFPCS
jgi:hypothetical protein